MSTVVLYKRETYNSIPISITYFLFEETTASKYYVNTFDMLQMSLS